MGNLASFSLNFLLGVSTRRLKTVFSPEYHVSQRIDDLFKNPDVLEFRALAALYYHSLMNYDAWADAHTFREKATSALAEYECDLFQHRMPLHLFISSRSGDLSDFLRSAIQRHNALLRIVYDKVNCGLPFDIFEQLTYLAPLNPNMIARSRLFYENRRGENIVWFRDEVLDLNTDSFLSYDFGLWSRLNILKNSPVKALPVDERMEKRLSEYLKEVFIDPVRLSEFKHAYALLDVHGNLSRRLEEFMEMSAQNDIDIKPLARTDLPIATVDDIVISDEHSYVGRQCKMQPSTNFGGLTPIGQDLFPKWRRRVQPNLFIVNRYRT